MFKQFGKAWKTHTPKYLHPYTKENILAQIAVATVLVVGMMAHDEWKVRQEKKRRNKIYPVSI